MIENKELKINIPCHWNQQVLNEICSRNQQAITPVTEIYGVLANGGPVGHGRSPDAVVSVNQESAIKFRNECRKNNLNFTYLLNAPFEFSKDKDATKKVDEYLDWIVNTFATDAVTISSHELMKHVRNRFPLLDIHISTIAAVKNVSDLEKYLDVSPNRVIPHHNLGKQFSDLEQLIKFGEKNNIDIELLVTESCLYDCPNRRAHYEYLAHASKDSSFHTTCNSQKLKHPSELLMAGGVIRPEDISLYGDMGVKYVKLSGRSKPSQWLSEVAEAYQNNKYNGNLIRLLGIDPSLNSEDWIYLNNQALDGFIANFPKDSSDETKKTYCQKWIIDLYQTGDFKLNDQSSFKITNQSLIIDVPGPRASQVIHQENR